MRNIFTLCGVMHVALAGCGSGSLLPPPNPVTGKVTMDGQAFEGANVQFIATGGNIGHGATGVTDAAGQYKLRGSLGGDGAGRPRSRMIVS